MTDTTDGTTMMAINDIRERLIQIERLFNASQPRSQIHDAITALREEVEAALAEVQGDEPPHPEPLRLRASRRRKGHASLAES
jgi:hypothetical protein